MTNIAFLGMGAMGARMARRLIDAGHGVTVWNRSPERVGPLVAAGARGADSPRRAAEGAEVVLSMVRDDDASRAVWLDADTGALSGMQPGALALECSTLTPGWVRALASEVSARSLRFLEAPVAGSRPQAEAGQLIFFVGGEAADLERARPWLDAMGGAVHPTGPVGTGAAIKLAVNTLFGVQVAAMAEVLASLRAQGIETPRAVEILSATPVASPAAKGAAALIASGRYAPLFPVELVEKDFGYAVDAASDVGVDAPTSAAVRALYRRALEAGHGAENIHAVARLWD